MYFIIFIFILINYLLYFFSGRIINSAVTVNGGFDKLKIIKPPEELKITKPLEEHKIAPTNGTKTPITNGSKKLDVNGNKNHCINGSKPNGISIPETKSSKTPVLKRKNYQSNNSSADFCRECGKPIYERFLIYL